MDWSNERYVRLYTRDTKTWCLLGWEGQVLLPLIFRKVDRSGVLDDVHGADDLLVLLQNGMPIEVVRVGLGRLLERGVVEFSAIGLVIPNFMEAQEASQTDAQRAREYRARRRDTARTQTSRIVTESEKSITNRDDCVTAHHSPSQSVTPPLPSVPSVPSVPDPPLGPPTGDKTTEPTSGSKGKGKRSPTVRRQLSDDWQPREVERRLAVELGVDCDDQAQRFRDWHRANAKPLADPDAAFRNWLRKAADGERRLFPTAPRDARAQTAADRQFERVQRLEAEERANREGKADA